MADTVKKSRIVSDDDENLEEALLEEFNMRLKSMSEDNLQQQINQEVLDDALYENISPDKSPFSTTTTSSEIFLESERLHHYDVPNTAIKITKTLISKDQDHAEESENTYETLHGNDTFHKTEQSDQYVKMSPPATQAVAVVDLNVSPVSPEITIEKISHEDCQMTVTSNESDFLDSSYEIVDPEELERPKVFLDKSVDDSAKSVKDRMFLSTEDAAATLLFTQTVTSPMLTPSEENIDFLKGFQRDINTSESSPSNGSPQDSIRNSEENSTSDSNIETKNGAPLTVTTENIYENAECVKHKADSIYENLEDCKKLSENMYENIKEGAKKIKAEEEEDHEEHIYQDIEDCKKESVYEEVSNNKTSTSQMKVDEVMVENVLYSNIDELNRSYLKETGNLDLDMVESSVDSDKIYETIKITEEMAMNTNHYDAVHNSEVLVTANNTAVESHSETITSFTEKVESSDRTMNRLEAIINESAIIHSENIDKCANLPESDIESPKTKEEVVHSSSEFKPVLNEKTQGSGSKGIVSSNNSHDTDANSLDGNNKNKETYSEFIHHSKTESNFYEKYTKIVSSNARNSEICNREKDTETVPAEIVKTLKCQFLKTSEVLTPSRKEVDDANEIKAINIMKQINKFENKDSIQSDESTVTECYTETTTFQSDVSGEKPLKKKKTKKTRKEEKENISVTDDVGYGENVYNVNVKNLCRSFGDLTKIPNDDLRCKGDVKNGGRIKSLSEVLLTSYKTSIENVFSEVSVRSLKEKFNIVENKNPLGIVKTPFKNSVMKSSFSKFDALQKKNVLHIRSSDSERAQEKFNDNQQNDSNSCKACSKQVFQMELIKAEKAVWHKNCFRCAECNKQLSVETYASHEGYLYCKPHFKSLFAPKVVEDDAPSRPRKPELIIRENEPLELPPDVVRASDKPDLGLEELQKLNVKERFQVFEHYQSEAQDSNRGQINPLPKKSPTILSKLAKFQAKGMDVGVSDDALNGIPIEESSSEQEDEDDEIPEGEDPTLYRARKAQKEKPFHFTNLHEVKNKWEHGEQNSKDERREERKQEIQSIRNKLFMGKQGKMKEAYQQAVMQSESSVNIHKAEEKIESCDTKSLKERFEKGHLMQEKIQKDEDEETEVYQSEISKKSRSLFLELDANASKPPQISPVTPQKLDVKKAREAYLAKTASEDTVKSSEVIEDVIEVKTADIQQRFKFFETYKEPEKERKQFRITPPRDPSQVKTGSPEREIYHDPDVVRAEDFVDDSVIAKTTHTASKMLSKFRQMEENLSKEPEPSGPKPLKRFTPPPEPARKEETSEEESGSEEEEEEEERDQIDNQKLPEDLIEAQKAARAKKLRAKFEKWEADEIRREQSQSVNMVEEYGEESQIESTKTLRARFESMRASSSEKSKTPKVKVNRFVEMPCYTEACQGCEGKVYPLEKITVHGYIFHKSCFKCKECSCVLRMDSYSYNQGLLYCTPHFKRLFISKGNYDTAFGLDQNKEKKWNLNATIA